MRHFSANGPGAAKSSRWRSSSCSFSRSSTSTRRPLPAAEVVVDEREAHPRAVGDRARARAAMPLLDQHLAGRLDDPVAGRLPSDRPPVGRLLAGA